MITNLELYGTENVPKVPKKVCNERLALLEVHLKKVMSKHWMEHDNHTINLILSAKRHWAKLRDGEAV